MKHTAFLLFNDSAAFRTAGYLNHSGRSSAQGKPYPPRNDDPNRRIVKPESKTFRNSSANTSAETDKTAVKNRVNYFFATFQ
jgi:hypothetical protein